MERSYASAVALAGRATGPMSEHLGSFVGTLIQQRYVPAVVYVKARHAWAFDGWLAKQHVRLLDLTEAHVVRFERRRRRGPVRAQTKHAEHRDVVALLRFLRAIGACPAAPCISTPAEHRATDYEHYLRNRSSGC